MLRDALFTLLAQRLGSRSDLISRMEVEVGYLQESVLEQHNWFPWFLETELTDLVTIAGEEAVALPSDFLGEVEGQGLWRYDTQTTPYMHPLKKMLYDDMILRYPGSGVPYAYALGPATLRLGHIPQDVYALKFRYFAKDTVLDSNITNKWLTYAGDVVIAELGAVMAEKHMQHPALGKVFRDDAVVAWNKLYGQHIAREEMGLSRVMEA